MGQNLDAQRCLELDLIGYGLVCSLSSNGTPMVPFEIAATSQWDRSFMAILLVLPSLNSRMWLELTLVLDML